MQCIGRISVARAILAIMVAISIIIVAMIAIIAVIAVVCEYQCDFYASCWKHPFLFSLV